MGADPANSLTVGNEDASNEGRSLAPTDGISLLVNDGEDEGISDNAEEGSVDDSMLGPTLGVRDVTMDGLLLGKPLGGSDGDSLRIDDGTDVGGWL